jgi:hypothetical protein
VTARRAQLAPRVSKFVRQISVPEDGGEGGLARWQAPVCPLVSGLPRQDGEFILERLSEIARMAGAPLADEHCRPNLYILVTGQPEQLLKGMEKRNRPFTFGYDFSSRAETPANVVDEFIRTPRTVRVWYNSDRETPDYTTPTRAFPYNLAEMNNGGGLPEPTSSEWERSSRVTSTSVWTFSRVFVVVDQRRLHGVTRGQLADYVGMVGLVKVNPDAHLGDAQTILKLFAEAPRAAPAGMTDWDRAFLKSLYATEQSSKVQRALIAKGMVREIVH